MRLLSGEKVSPVKGVVFRFRVDLRPKYYWSSAQNRIFITIYHDIDIEGDTGVCGPGLGF